MTTKPAPRTVRLGWVRLATHDHRCAFVEGDVKRDRVAVVFFTGGDTGEACRFVGRLDHGRGPAATMADNGVVWLFEANQPWTTVTSGVLGVDRLIGSARRLGARRPGRAPLCLRDRRVASPERARRPGERQPLVGGGEGT